MENLDISDKLKGFNCTKLTRDVKSYYDMLSSFDEETQLLGASLILEDSSFFNFVELKYGADSVSYIKTNLNYIFDKSKIGRSLFIVRIIATLSRILHGHHPVFNYG